MPAAIQQKILNVYYELKEREGYQQLYNSARLIRKASRLGIALGGSTGLHLGYLQANKIPGDLDFVTEDHAAAWDLLRDYYMSVTGYAHHGKMYIQNRTAWCPEMTTAHYHVESTIHLPFCIMILKHGTLNSWYDEAGICLQWSQDIFDAADKLTKRDNKPRSEPFLEYIETEVLLDELGDDRPPRGFDAGPRDYQGGSDV
jgi:hypothetical protein